MKQFSELPTVAETTVLKDYDAAVMFATWAPAKTPRDVLSRLHDETVRALQMPEFRSRLEREGASEPIGNTPDQMAATIRLDMEKLGKLVKAANIQLQ
jgi:tripartite-type tricarboxylate transporter receptor subunit TctC